ncbi:aspartic peptidase domain-containing protein [Phlebopus sp. FC_14]|nr:aspartic peptidase domain-containing protein [Phlebopus sp. FC_14]
MTGTHAKGLIGFDTVSVTGLVVPNQYFAAINSTNTSVVETDSSGIFGLGFPINSVLWMDVHLDQRRNQSVNRTVQSRSPTADQIVNANARFPDRLKNLVTRWFPKNDMSNPDSLDVISNPYSKRQTQTSAADLLASFSTAGPLIPRLVAQGALNLPMFTVTLQRDAIEVGGNEGILSVGDLPPTVKNESLTWVPVRGYSPEQGGLRPPSDAPSEVYPIAWEIPVDDVYFDGIKLPRSRLSPPTISLSALIDTGNSLVRGPPDVITHIHTLLGGPQFPCSFPHTLSFQIGGKQFPVDPRDFVSQVRSGDVNTCAANLAPTDVPAVGGTGYLYSWNLGDPFLKSVLAAFYYGSLARPSQDPPRIGLLSTIDPNASKALCDDKHRAENDHTDYPDLVEPAPASVPPSRSTGIDGVPLAQVPSMTKSGTSRFGGGSGRMVNHANGVKEGFGIRLSVWTALTGFVGWVGWRTMV